MSFGWRNDNEEESSPFFSWSSPYHLCLKTRPCVAHTHVLDSSVRVDSLAIVCMARSVLQATSNAGHIRLVGPTKSLAISVCMHLPAA